MVIKGWNGTGNIENITPRQQNKGKGGEMNALIYAAGVVTGFALMIANRYSVKKAVELERSRNDQLREENRRMRDELVNFTHASDCRDAYRRGRQEGREDPVNQAERFARQWEGKRVQFRGGKSA
jgi:hypothetical protein